MTVDPSQCRHLDEQLQHGAAGDRPGDGDGEVLGEHTGPGREDHDDLGEVPDDGCRVRDEEAAVAVQHAEAPRGEHEHADTGGHDLHEVGRELVSCVVEAGCDQPRQRSSRDHPEQHHRCDHRQQEGEHRVREACRCSFVLVDHRRVHRDERRRQDALAEEVLQQVRDAQGVGERVARTAEPEAPADERLADEARDTRQGDARRHGHAAGSRHREVLMRRRLDDVGSTGAARDPTRRRAPRRRRSR